VDLNIIPWTPTNQSPPFCRHIHKTALLCFRTILLSIISLLNEPNTFSPANVDASVMYRKWKDSRGKDKEYETIIKWVPGLLKQHSSNTCSLFTVVLHILEWLAVALWLSFNAFKIFLSYISPLLFSYLWFIKKLKCFEKCYPMCTAFPGKLHKNIWNNNIKTVKSFLVFLLICFQRIEYMGRWCHLSSFIMLEVDYLNKHNLVPKLCL